MQIVEVVKRFVYHLFSTKGRLAGIRIGKLVKIASHGRYAVHSRSLFVFSDEVWLAEDHEIVAEQDAEIHIGRGVHFGRRAKLHAGPGARLYVDSCCSFNHDVSIVALAEIRIGSNSIAGPYCYITDYNHGIEKGILIKSQVGESSPVAIGTDAWLGVGVTILKGAIIGDGAVIAARAVVNKSVPANEIWGGIPARRIGERA